MDKLAVELIKNKVQKEAANIQIVSGSMLPLIKIDEQLDLVRLPTELKVFDIIVFYDNEKLVCHFVWKDQRDFNKSVITRSLREPYKNETPRDYNNIIGWVPSKKVPFKTKAKIIFFSWIRGAL